jgi:hypothetical protein
MRPKPVSAHGTLVSEDIRDVEWLSVCGNPSGNAFPKAHVRGEIVGGHLLLGGGPQCEGLGCVIDAPDADEGDVHELSGGLRDLL